MPHLDHPVECPRCRGEGVGRNRLACEACGGMGTTDSSEGYEVMSPAWEAVDPVLRWQVGRLLFGRDHPHFQGDRR